MRKRTVLLLGSIGLLLATAAGAYLGGVRGLAVLAASAACLLVLLWVGVNLFRRFLWRVGRKLAFSYFLIGVLPIPLVVVLIGVALYLLSGTLVGHLFRDTVLELHDEVEEATTASLERYRRGAGAPAREGDLRFRLLPGGPHCRRTSEAARRPVHRRRVDDTCARQHVGRAARHRDGLLAAQHVGKARRTSTRSPKPITFIARAAAPTLPGWLVCIRMNRVGSADIGSG